MANEEIRSDAEVDSPSSNTSGTKFSQMGTGYYSRVKTNKEKTRLAWTKGDDWKSGTNVKCRR